MLSMSSIRAGGWALGAALALWLGPASAADTGIERVNRGVVELETGATGGISTSIASDLADLLDDGATRRVLPVIGEGSLQNIADLKALHGIDLAIIQADVLEYARTQKLYSGTESLTYVAKLYNEEFHLLARRDIHAIGDLAGKKVNFDGRGGGTGVTASRIFAVLGVAVVPTSFPTSVALEKLAKGDLDAVALVAGKPAPAFRDLDSADGLHFLAIPLKGQITAAYAPTRLTVKDYPGLVPDNAPVDTVAVSTVLAAANLTPGSDRYRNVVNFVDAFFTQFPTLLEPGHHAKWHEVNLSAELPGWKRFPTAQQWLDRNAPAVAKQAPQAPQDMKAVFEKFLDERLRLNGGTAMTQQQKDDLFGQFEHWQASQAH